MTATATTTISGVSLLTRQRRAEAAVFALGLSPEGIEIRRPGRPVQHLAWDRVSEWEVADHKGDLLLTLRGDGATTRLIVPGWDVDGLVGLLRDLTTSEPSPPQPPDDRAVVDQGAAPAAAEATTPAPAVAVATPPQDAQPPHGTDADARRSRARRRRARRPWWKPVVAAALLVLLATAVALVLLQSAGLISWSFLGPNGGS